MLKKRKPIFIIGAIIISISIMLLAFLVVAASGGIAGKDSRPKLVFYSGSAEKVFDGTPLIHNEWDLLSGSLKKGETVVASFSESKINVGSESNQFTVSIKDKKGKNITGKYNIEYQFGLLTVFPHSFIIASNSASKEYDDTPLTCDDYTVEENSILDSHTLVVEVFGSQTEAGIGENLFSAVVTDQKGEDVTFNYDIEKHFGSLEVLKRKITVKSFPYIQVYDGKAATNPQWQVVSQTQVLPYHDISVTVIGSQTDVGISSNTISQVIITHSGVPVTQNYEITKVEGDLVVTRREITVRSDSAEKPYDGEPLTNNIWGYSTPVKIVEGESIEVVITGSRTMPGEEENTIFEVIVYNEWGKDISFNYYVNKQEGLLVVTDDTPPTKSDDALDDSGEIDDSFFENDLDDDTVLLSVLSEVSHQIYLRLLSFGDYDGSSWSEGNEYLKLINQTYNLNYLTGIALQNAGYQSFKASMDSAYGDYVLPYYLDTALLNYAVQTSDVEYTGSTQDVYSAYYYAFDYLNSLMFTPNLAAYSQLEEEYFQFVLDNYLFVPNGTLSYLDSYIKPNIEISNPDNKNLTPAIIQKIVNAVKESAEYNLDYDKNLNSSSDIVKDFLSVYKQGICQHFASAATLLFRSYDIPARYVIGYTKGTIQNEWVDINPINAHAWVEIYIKGLGWVMVDATPDDDIENGNDGGGGNNSNDPNKTTLNIKPEDLSMKYYSGAVLNAQGANHKILGLDTLLKQGFTYSTFVTGSQSLIGSGKSTIESFKLFDIAGRDVTDNYNINKSHGKLQLYANVLQLITPHLTKVYDGNALTTNNEYTIGGDGLFPTHTAHATFVGSQILAGKSENKVNIVITDENGYDVTDYYKIENRFSMLEVKPRSIIVSTYSATKKYDSLPLTCLSYALYSDYENPLADGERIEVEITASQTSIGQSQNEIESIVVFNKDGKNVTSSYQIIFENGWLTVTP